MLINPAGTAARTMAKITVITLLVMTGLRLDEPLRLAGVGVVGVAVDAAADGEGFVFEAFLKIAASGELADRPRSSVTTPIVMLLYGNVYVISNFIIDDGFKGGKK